MSGRTPNLKPSEATRFAEMERRLTELEARTRAMPSRLVSSATASNVIMVSQTTHGLAVKDVVRHNGTSWTKSQADTAANAVVGGIVVAVPSPDIFYLAMSGRIAGLSGLTAGSVHYLSSSTAGALTTTAPSLAVPVLLADTTSSGVLLSMSQGGGIAPTEDGTVFCSNSGGTAGEWVFDVDIGRNAASKAGVVRVKSPDASGDAVVIDGALVTASTKKLTIREIDVCDAGVAKKMLILGCAPY